MRELSSPFARLTTLLEGLKEKLEPAMKRILWPFNKEGVEETVKKIERIKTLMIIAVQRDHVALSHEIQEKLTVVDTKVDGILDSMKSIERVAGCVYTKVDKVGDGVSRMQSLQQKFRDSAHLLFSSPSCY